MQTDTLSDVLQGVHLRGAVFFDVDAHAPWVAEAPAAREIAPSVMPKADQVIEYHVVTKGSCWAAVIGHDEIPPVRLSEGDVVAFPQGDAHVLSSDRGMRGGLNLSFAEAQSRQLPITMELDGGGEAAQIVCGFLGCDARPFNPLLQALPRMLHVSRQPGAEYGATEAFMRFALLETREQRVGAASILSRVGEILFAELVRRHIETLPPDAQGWLGGLRDRHVGRALALIHAEPGRNWTLETLAAETGLSRSPLAARFSSYIGVAPIQYLQRWRLQLAASQLAGGEACIGDIAATIGYESEAAFNRAFRRVVGVPPAAWRRRHRDVQLSSEAAE